LHGNGIIARSGAHAHVALMRSVNLVHVDLDIETGALRERRRTRR
jgi:hypothetical protein